MSNITMMPDGKSGYLQVWVEAEDVQAKLRGGEKVSDFDLFSLLEYMEVEMQEGIYSRALQLAMDDQRPTQTTS